MEASKEFLRMLESAQSLQNIPDDEKKIPKEIREVIENLIK